MNKFLYSAEKDKKIKEERGISFDEIIMFINEGYVLDVQDHPDQLKYPNQKIYILNIEGYLWLVSYVRHNNQIFLKTAFPSRKHTKQYMMKDEKWLKN